MVLGAACKPFANIATGDLSRFTVTRVVRFEHSAPRPRMVGKNALRDVHGDATWDSVLRIETNQGLTGIGSGDATLDAMQALVGRRLDTVWTPGIGMTSPLERADHALYDLVGKALDVPAWRLLGGEGPEWVPIYDGSIYFDDLLPGSRGIDTILDNVRAGLDRGHRAFKIKVGRGFKWMEKNAGFERDIAVVKEIRSATPADVKLMVDANNGYDLETTKRFLDAIATDLFFIEEMFPEDVASDLALKGFLRERGLTTRVADGESARDVGHFDGFLAERALDLLQPDIRALGIDLQWELSQRAAARSVALAPHNWGSHLGLYMTALLSRGLSNVVFAEMDTATSDLFDTSAWELREGKLRVPDLPGCGIVMHEDVWRERYAEGARTTS